MNAKQQVILIELLDINKKCFRELQRSTKISPRILKNHLNTLKKKGLVDEEINNSWSKSTTVDNRPRLYSLTSKGMAKALKEKTIHSKTLISRGLSMLESVTANLDPQKIREMFNSELADIMEISPSAFKELADEYEKTLLVQQDPSTLKQFTEDNEKFGDSARYYDESGEECDGPDFYGEYGGFEQFSWERLILAQQELMDPILDSMFRLHLMLTRLREPDSDCDNFVTVIKDTKPLTIPVKFLEGIDFDLLSYLTSKKDTKSVQWEYAINQLRKQEKQ
jgi:DNA-binding MarR family transcriptional regulator